MDTDRSNIPPQQSPQQPQGQENKAAIQQDILRKKEKINKIKNFLQLKIKIHQLISMKKLDEAKDTYYTLYTLYQDIIKDSDEQEIAKLQSDISAIYSKLTSNMKANVNQDNPEKKTSSPTLKKEKVITTDFDMIVKTVEEKGKISLSEIQSQFKISRRLAEEWIQILADYGLVEIKYLPVGGIEILKIEK